MTPLLKTIWTGFLSLQPESVSPDGEFAQIISADQVVSWFEENGDKNDLPEEVTALRKVGEEDNPVVIIIGVKCECTTPAWKYQEEE